VVAGGDVDYRGQKSGYTKDPQEAINYASKHDNETIWDISQYKHATGTPARGSACGPTTSPTR